MHQLMKRVSRMASFYHAPARASDSRTRFRKEEARAGLLRQSPTRTVPVMYREADDSPRCTACGKSNVTPPTRFVLDQGVTAGLVFAIRNPEKGWLAKTARAFDVDRARVCLDCGHVMLALGPKRLEELRSEVAGLLPMAEGG